MTQNVLIFNNQTPAPVQFIVYLRDPQSFGSSVVWQQMPAPPRVPAPLTWSDDWSAAYGSVADDIVSPLELKPTNAGRRWVILNGTEGLELVEQGTAPPDYVQISNSSGQRTNPGVGLGGSGASYILDVLSNATAQFKITALDYWITIPSLPMQTGQLIPADTTFLLEPVRLTGPIAATLTLTGPPFVATVSHTVGEPSALLRAARQLE